MFLINLHGKDSIYEQIRSQILRFIQVGYLKADDKLPSVRELSTELGINPNTVLKAYQKLEEEGYIYILSKKGAFISKMNEKSITNLLYNLTKDIKRYKDEGIEKDDILEIIEKVYGD